MNRPIADWTAASLVAPPLPDDHVCAPCPIRARTFCSRLDAETLARFKAQGPTIRLEAARSLFHEEDPSRFVYNVTKGCLKVYKLLPDGRRQITGFVFAGDFLGITFGPHHLFTAETVEASEYCRFPRERFDAFVATRPDMARSLLAMAAHELRLARDQMLLLGRKTAAERLATFLLMLFDRAGEAPGGRTVAATPMTRLDMADYLGLTKETVSRTFTLLKTRRIVRPLGHDRIELVARAPLAAIAGGFAD